MAWEHRKPALHPLASLSTRMNCTDVIPTNPDISGVGVCIAIYFQTFLSFILTALALTDGKISVDELKAVERQSTTILITAFAILISALIQLHNFSLSSFHTSIILNLSWLNNTNALIWLVLYISYKCDTEVEGDRVKLEWSAWIKHFLPTDAWYWHSKHEDLEKQQQEGILLYL
jgi:hypothetical protein